MIGSLIGFGTTLIEKLIPDPQEKQRAKLKLVALAQSGELAALSEQARNIRSEINGESWLQRNWRPLTMLTFTALVVAHWLGFTAPNLSEAQTLALLDIVQVGLGGYILGRSGEKMMKAYKNDT